MYFRWMNYTVYELNLNKSVFKSKMEILEIKKTWSVRYKIQEIYFKRKKVYLILLCSNCIYLFTQIEGLWQPSVEQVYRYHFFQYLLTLCLCITIWLLLQYFNFLIIIIFVTVIWVIFMLKLQKDYDSLKAQMMVSIF